MTVGPTTVRESAYGLEERKTFEELLEIERKDYEVKLPERTGT